MPFALLSCSPNTSHHPPLTADADDDVWVSLGDSRIASTSPSGNSAAGSACSVGGVCYQNKLSNSKRGGKVGGLVWWVAVTRPAVRWKTPWRQTGLLNATSGCWRNKGATCPYYTYLSHPVLSLIICIVYFSFAWRGAA